MVDEVKRPLPGKSAAKQMQDKSIKPPEKDPEVSITAILDNGHEISLVLPESVVRLLVDPDVPNAFIQVPIPDVHKNSVRQKFLHTSRFKEVWLHNDLRKPIGG